MIKIFKKTPRNGRPISTIGFADGLHKMAYAWENLSMRGGHIEWDCWGAPTIVVDPAAISDVLNEGESGESKSGESVVARVLSGDSVAGYVVRCYPAFPSDTGRFDAKLAVLDIALGATLPVDTYLIAHLAGLQLIGGN